MLLLRAFAPRPVRHAASLWSRFSLVLPGSTTRFSTSSTFTSSRTYRLTPMAATAVDALAGLVKGFSIEEAASKYPNCHPDTNPIDLYRAHLTNVLTGVTGVDAQLVYNALQWTTSLEKGDLILATPALRVKGKKPDELARAWVAAFPADDPLVETPTVNGYFVQFFFKALPLLKYTLPLVRGQGAEFGNNKTLGLVDPADPSKGQKRIIIEFSSPNIAKPFHAGHLRSTIIGGFLANLYAGAGWDVTRINYLGDWGKQYGLLALGFERFGDEAALQSDPINHLFQIYVKINNELATEKEQMAALKAAGKDDEAQALADAGLDEQARQYFRKMTDGDEAALAQWKRFRDLSIVRYKDTYARLNIHFDSYSGESQVPEAAMEKAAAALAERNITEESDGALLVDFAKHVPGKEGKRLERPLVRKRDGTALYLTRDISELLGRAETYKFDQMIYVVASAQDLHLKQLFKIVELMGHKEIAAKCQHINFGLVLGMSTRKGTVKFLDDILRDVADAMHDVMRSNETKYAQIEDPAKTADTLGISAVMVQDMTGKRINNYTFDLAKMTSFEGDTGPYLQYAHARLCSIERRVSLSADELASADTSLLNEPHAVNLVRLLAQWPDVVQNTLKTLEPTTVLTYLFKMTHALSSSYDHLQVVGSEPELLKARASLYASTRIVLNNGMRLLGLSPVERM